MLILSYDRFISESLSSLLEYNIPGTDPREHPWDYVTPQFAKHVIDYEHTPGIGYEILADDPDVNTLLKEYKILMNKAIDLRHAYGLDWDTKLFSCDMFIILESHDCEAYARLFKRVPKAFEIKDGSMDHRIKNSVHFAKYFALRLKDSLHETVERLDMDMNNKLAQDRIPIYRSIKVSDEWIDRLSSGRMTRLGTYWSYTREGAQPYWASSDELNEVILEARIDYKNVDWVMTYLMNSQTFGIPQETELRLLKNTPIKLIRAFKINRDDYSLDVDYEKIPLASKTFKA